MGVRTATPKIPFTSGPLAGRGRPCPANRPPPSCPPAVCASRPPCRRSCPLRLPATADTVSSVSASASVHGTQRHGNTKAWHTKGSLTEDAARAGRKVTHKPARTAGAACYLPRWRADASRCSQPPPPTRWQRAGHHAHRLSYCRSPSVLGTTCWKPDRRRACHPLARHCTRLHTNRSSQPQT